VCRFPSESNKTPQEVLSKFDNMSLKPAQSKASASHSKSRTSKQRSGNSGLVGSPVKSTGRISSKSSKIIHKVRKTYATIFGFIETGNMSPNEKGF